MRNRHANGMVWWMVTLVVLALVAGCGRQEPTTESQYVGSWAQVPDIVGRLSEPNIPAREFNVTEYGAVGDGQTNCYEAFTSAVAACEAAGGGRVLVPTGTFLVQGPIHFASNMDLHLAEGAHVKFGGKYDDYLPLAMTRWKGTRVYNYSPFIYAYRKHHISLTGTGTLDGQARDTWATWTEKEKAGAETALRMNEEGNSVIDRFLGDGHFLRPSMIQFLGCDHVLVDGVRIVDSPFWCLHPVFSRQMTIRNVRFDAQNPDNDAIVLDSCADVHVHELDFNNRGAGVVVYSGTGREGRELARASRNIYIHDCIFDDESGVAIGAQTAGGVYNVFVEDCRTPQGPLPDLAIPDESTREGEIVHVRLRDGAAAAQDPNAPNQAPEVYAGPDIQLSEQGGPVTLSGSVADDGKPSPELTYAWSVIQGSADAVTLTAPTNLTTQATFSQPGVYVLQLEASDGQATGHHFLIVKVGEQPEGMEAVTRPVFPASN